MTLLLSAGCAKTTPSNEPITLFGGPLFCDATELLLFGSAGVVDYLIENDRALVNAIAAQNELFVEECT